MDGLGNVDQNTVTKGASPFGPLGAGTFLETFEAPSGFDNVGWAVTNPIAGATNPWLQSSNKNQTPGGTYSSFDIDDPARSEHAMETPALPISATSVLTFWHTWSFENSTNTTTCPGGATTAAQCSSAGRSSCYDGGVLEYKLGAGAWTRVTGAQITGSTYNALIDNNSVGCTDNPLGKLIPAYVGGTGALPALLQATVNLGTITGAGSVKFRWLQGDDTANSAQSTKGWYVDDVSITNVTSGIPGTCTTGICTVPSGVNAPTVADPSACAATGINVTWTAPTWNGTGPGTYLVLRDGVTVASGTCSGSFPAATLTCLDNTAPVGAHTYQVRATNGCAGVTTSVASGSVTDNADTTMPTWANPNERIAKAAPNMNFSWAVATDPSAPITYTTYRSTSFPATWASQNTTTTLAWSNGADLASATSYFYSTTAKDACNNQTAP